MNILKFIIIFILTNFLTFTTAFADPDPMRSNEEDKVQHISANIDLASGVKRYERAKLKIVAKAIYPELYGDDDLSESVDYFNQLVLDFIQEEFEKFKNRVIEDQANIKNIPKEFQQNNSLDIDYNASVIVPNNKPLISIRFSMEGYLSGMAHPYHYHRVLNYDLEAGKKIELNELFEPDANYLEVIATYCRKELNKKFSDIQQMVIEGTAPTPGNYKNWNIQPSGLFITFDEYQVAPYSAGTQSVLVPYSVLKQIVSEDSVIAVCVNKPKKCNQGKILTGGFIDEVAVNARNHRLNPILG